MSVLKVGAISPNSGTKVNITGSTLLVTTASGHFSGSYSGDGSGLDGTGGLPFTGSGTVSGSLLVTGSSTLALRVSGSTALTGSLFVSGTISGSFIGNGSGITSVSSISSSTSVLAQTASVATRANALAPTVTATSSSTAIMAQTASVAVRATTLSAQATASFADVAGTVHDGNITAAKIATDAVITAKILNSNVTNAKLANDSVIIGTTEIDLGATTATLTGLTSISAITASFVLQTFESSSTVITSGSNIFGDKANDIQQITGSLLQTGSAVVSGSLDVAVGTISGSFRGDGSNLTGISSYTVANSSNNRVLTSVDADNGNAEANLTFDGSTLTVAGSINETSAKRFKENIQTLGNQLNNVLQLNPVEFDWIRDGKHDIGLIAEEVNEVIPDLVQKEGKEIQGIHYSRLTAILISAVKELTARVEELENK